MSQDLPTFVANQKIITMQKVKIDPFTLVGISIRTTNENGKSAKDIADLWNKFMSENISDKIPNKIDNTVYSLYTDYEGDHTKPYTTILGCKTEKISQLPEGLMAKSFEGGDYMKTSAKGDLMKGIVVNKWTEIWAMDLDRKFTADFEVYGEKAQNPSDAEVEFFIAIK